MLLINDNITFCSILSRALKKHKFQIRIAHSITTTLSDIQNSPPKYTIIDLKLPDQSKLLLISKLKTLNEQTQIIILTGYTNITTTIKTIKLNTTYYLNKPANTDNIITAFHHKSNDHSTPISEKPLSINHLK